MLTRTRKLPWPMSRIDRDVLHELWLLGQQTRRPISAIVADAVVAHLNQRFLESAATPSPHAAATTAA